MEVSCPERVTVGDDLHATVRVTSRVPVEVAEADLWCVSRTSRHERRRQWRVTTGAVGWDQATRRHSEQTVSGVALAAIRGRHPAGALAEATVRLGTFGVPATALLPNRFGEVSNFLEARVVCADGAVATSRCRVFVRPRRPGPGDSGAAPAPSSTPGLSITQGGAGCFGQLRRPIDATAGLRTGATAAPAGRLTVDLRCVARWEVHDLARTRSPGGRGWREVGREQETTEHSTRLCTVDTPALGSWASAEVPFSGSGPGGLAQSTDGPDGSIAWRLEATWSAGPVTVTASAPIVMAMPPPRADQDGAPARWRRRRWRR